MPDYRDVRVNVTLSNFVRNYKFENKNFVADIVAPPVNVTTSVGTYKTLGRELLTVQHSDALGPEGMLNRIGYDMGSGTYECLPYGLKILVTDREIKQAPAGFDPMRQAAVTILHALKLRQEMRVVALAAAASTSAPDCSVTPTYDWDNASNDIVGDITSTKALFVANMGGWSPTHWLFGDHIGNEIAAQSDLATHVLSAAALARPTEIATLAFTGSSLPPEMFGMKVLQPDVYYNSALIGATEVLGNVWGSDSYFFYIDASPDSATWARQFRLSDIVIRQWRENDPAGWWVAGEWEVDEVQTTAHAIYRIVGVT